jgi:K+-sensing histidine kinase KdpD
MSVRTINSLVGGILGELESKMPASQCCWSYSHDENQNRHLIDSYSCYLIIRNLIQNSLQYAPGSPIYIESWADQDATRVSMADEGPGVEPEFQTNLFEAFNRGRFNDTRTGRPGNLGLGLYLVSELMKLHNGRVTYDTKYNQGARFILTFPPYPEDNPTKGSAP